MTGSAVVPPLHVRVMGVTVAIEAPDQDTRDRLARQWSRALAPREYDQSIGAVTAAPGPPETDAARDYLVTTEVTMAALSATAGERFNFHAGGLADERGRVLAIVGASGTGKTTATRLLAQRLAYLSDETVSLEATGVVHPHAKPLSVLVDPQRPGHKQQLSPDDLGLLPTPESGRLARFVVLRRGVPRPRGLVRLDEVEGMLELIEQSSSISRAPDPLVTLLRLVDDAGGIWALEYDEISDHLDTLVGMLADEIPPGGGTVPVQHPGNPDPVDEVAMAADLLRRLHWVDAVELDDELLVLLPSRAVRLDNLMATLWLELASPCSLEELVAAARAKHGDHPDAQALIEQAVAVMVEQQLVAWGTLA